MMTYNCLVRLIAIVEEVMVTSVLFAVVLALLCGAAVVITGYYNQPTETDISHHVLVIQQCTICAIAGQYVPIDRHSQMPCLAHPFAHAVTTIHKL